MSDELLPYYQAELRHIREMGRAFARDNEQIAGNLGIGNKEVEDPHVSRLIEAFAYLNARTKLKIDDDFPEITEAYLNILYPHYLHPIPSCVITKFGLGPAQAEQAEGHSIDRGALVETVEGSCKFQTSYPVHLVPVRVSNARLSHGGFEAPSTRWLGKSQGILRLSLAPISQKVPISEMNFSWRDPATAEVEASSGEAPNLRFYIDAAKEEACKLYEVLLCHHQGKQSDTGLLGVGITNGNGYVQELEADDAVRPVGFGVDDGTIPFSARSFIGYRLLTEYFAFYNKFLFFDVPLDGVDLSQFRDTLDIFFYLSERHDSLESSVDSSVFQLGCTPAINLFDHTAEPISVKGMNYEERVIANSRRPEAFEVYDILEVEAQSGQGKRQVYHPFYSLSHAESESDAYYYSTRRPAADSAVKGSDVWLSIVDLGFRPSQPLDWTLRTRVRCFNRDVPNGLKMGADGLLPMQMSGAGAGTIQVDGLTRPTQVRRPILGSGTRWRLISHLNLNALTLENGQDGADGLRELLRIYDHIDSSSTQEAISALTSFSVERVTGKVRSPLGQRMATHFCRGLECRIHLTEERFSGGEVFLFACILERFLSLYCSINSFVQTVVTTENRELFEWPPRTGDQLVV